MKKYILTFYLFTTTILCFSQVTFPINDQGKVEYSEVIKVDSSISDIHLYESAKEFFSTNLQNFQRGNSEKNSEGANLLIGYSNQNSAQVDILYINENPITLSEKNDKKIIARVVNKYTGGVMGCIRVLYFEYDIILKFKSSRYKFEVTNFRYTHYNQSTMKQMQLYGIKDSGDCNSKNSLENLLNCKKCKKEFQNMYQFLDSDTKLLISEMNKYIQNVKPEDDDW